MTEYRAGLCLPMAFLLRRVLAETLPDRPFFIRLGSLHVVPADDPEDAITFDPTTPEGIDAGFHAWLEDSDGTLLDPSVLLTLEHHGYTVDTESFVLATSRRCVRFGLHFLYDELPDLELLGVAESEPQISRMVTWALVALREERVPPLLPGEVRLDVGWRGGRGPQGST